MLFNSYVFLLAFLPLALAGFFTFARFSRRAGAVFLLLASLLFYGWWYPPGLVLLLASIGGNYACGRAIGAVAPPRRGWVLGLGIAVNLLVLIRYKYLATLLAALHAASPAIPAIAPIALPLGISFFTFTQIGYLIDRHGGVAQDRGLLSYALFVTFFPHLIAGPILSNREMIPQFADARIDRPNGANLLAGAAIFTIGLLKKCVLADPLAPLVQAGFAAPGGLSAIAAWHAVLAYALQLYFDFSGYSDMAIGLARLFNLRFPQNFNAPYRARSIIEYWQRWHMTLTRWLTLYLFNPLSLAALRRRAGRGLKAERPGATSLGGFGETLLVPLVVTMTLAGIWHGSGLQFLLFGLWHAMALSVNHAWRSFAARPSAHWFAARGLALPRLAVQAGCIGLTFFTVLVGAVLFRATSAGAGFAMLAAMAGANGPGHLLSLSRPIAAAQAAIGWAWLIALYTLIALAPTTQTIMGEDGTHQPDAPAQPWLRFRPSLPWALAGGMAAMLALLSVGGTTEFLYFQF